MASRAFASAVAAGAAVTECGGATVALIHVHVRRAPAIRFAAAVGTAIVVCHVKSISKANDDEVGGLIPTNQYLHSA